MTTYIVYFTTNEGIKDSLEFTDEKEYKLARQELHAQGRFAGDAIRRSNDGRAEADSGYWLRDKRRPLQVSGASSDASSGSRANEATDSTGIDGCQTEQREK